LVHPGWGSGVLFVQDSWLFGSKAPNTTLLILKPQSTSKYVPHAKRIKGRTAEHQPEEYFGFRNYYENATHNKKIQS